MTTPSLRLNDIPAWPTVRKYHDADAVDVVSLAAELGLVVWESPLPDHIQGKITLDPKHGGSAGYSIIVNSNEDILKQRFTVAHEVAHFLLHRDKIGDGLTDDALYNSGLTTLEEVQANRLAGEILMPFPLIEKAIKAGLRTTEEIANRLEVAKSALAVRLQLPD